MTVEAIDEVDKGPVDFDGPEVILPVVVVDPLTRL